jgi:peptidoglycan/xylan/chitin deacetylase (PgdA/CDA1 family)
MTGSRRGFLRLVGGTLAGAAVVGAAATSKAKDLTVEVPPEEPLGPPTVQIDFPAGELTAGTDVPRLVGEGGRQHPNAKRHSLEVIWNMDMEKKLVALTFDDGPVPGVSEMLYDILDEAKVKATFFMVGKRVREFEGLLNKRMDRHEVGNHTYSHESLFNKTDSDALQDMNDAHKAIAEVIGREPTLFRPPYSHVSGGTLVAAAAMGYDIVMWNNNIGYTGFEGDEARLVREVVQTTTPGSIVLCHDGGPEYLISIRNVPNIIAELKKQGYEFVTIPELRTA